MKKLFFILCLLSLIMVGQVALADSFNFQDLVKMNSLKPIDFDDRLRIERIIPTTLPPTRNGGLVMRKIADYSINNWLNDPSVKNSAMGRTANSMQNSMKADMSIKSSEPNGINHKFQLTYMAFENFAKLDYSGFLNATLRYSPIYQKTEVEVLKKLETNKVFVIGTANDALEVNNHVGLRWTY